MPDKYRIFNPEGPWQGQNTVIKGKGLANCQASKNIE